MSREPTARPAHRARGAVLRVLPALLLTALMSAVLTPVPPAAAHTTLLESSPQQGAHVEEVPTSLRLTFSEDVTPRFMQVALTVDGGAPLSLESHVDGPLLTAEVPPDVAGRLPEAAATSWRVDYRVVSADGHPVTGAVEFMVAPSETTSTGSPDGEATQAPTAGAVVPAPSEPRPSRGPGPGASWRWMIAAGALVAVLASGAVAMRRERRRRPDAGG